MATPTHTGYSPPPFGDSPATLDVSQSSGTPTVDTKKQAVTPKAHAMPVLVNNDGTAEQVDSSSTDGSSRSRPVRRVVQTKRDPTSRRRKPRRESSNSSTGTTSPRPKERAKKKNPAEGLPEPNSHAGSFEPTGPTSTASSSTAPPRSEWRQEGSIWGKEETRLPQRDPHTRHLRRTSQVNRTLFENPDDSDPGTRPQRLPVPGSSVGESDASQVREAENQARQAEEKTEAVINIAQNVMNCAAHDRDLANRRADDAEQNAHLATEQVRQQSLTEKEQLVQLAEQLFAKKNADLQEEVRQLRERDAHEVAKGVQSMKEHHEQEKAKMREMTDKEDAVNRKKMELMQDRMEKMMAQLEAMQQPAVQTQAPAQLPGFGEDIPKSETVFYDIDSPLKPDNDDSKTQEGPKAAPKASSGSDSGFNPRGQEESQGENGQHREQGDHPSVSRTRAINKCRSRNSGEIRRPTCSRPNPTATGMGWMDKTGFRSLDTVRHPNWCHHQ